MLHHSEERDTLMWVKTGGSQAKMKNSNLKRYRGLWVAQLVKCPTSAQVMISPVPSSSLESGCVLTAQSLEPASDSVSPSLFSPPLSHSPSKINIKKKFFFNE